jgi:hypothetical protein
MQKVGFALIAVAIGLLAAALVVRSMRPSPTLPSGSNFAPVGFNLEPESAPVIELVHPDRLHFSLESKAAVGISEGRSITARFRNVSGQRVRVVSGEAGCGCIKVKVSPDWHDPGSEFEIELALDSEEAVAWRASYGVTIFLDGGEVAWRGVVTYERVKG